MKTHPHIPDPTACRRAPVHDSGCVSAVGLSVPQRRGADRERADVAIEESSSLPSLPRPSTTRITELQ
jgi:hypothetical protein